MNTWFLTLIVALACVAKVTGYTTTPTLDYDDTTTEASTEMTTEASDETTTEAYNEMTTEASDETTTEAYNEMTTEASDETTTEAYKEMTIEASDEMTTEASDETTVKVSDEMTIEASDETTVKVSDEMTTEASDETTAEASDDNCGQAFENVRTWRGTQEGNTYTGTGPARVARVALNFKRNVLFTIDSLSVTPISGVTKLTVIGFPESGDKLRAVFKKPAKSASITKEDVVAKNPNFKDTVLTKLVIDAKGKKEEPTFVVDSATACKV